MSFVDKIKETVAGNEDKVDQAIDKVGDIVDEKTGRKHTDKIDKAEQVVKDNFSK